MSDFFESTRFLVLWFLFAGFMFAAIAAVLIWAVKTGQFRNSEHASRLPLESGLPPEEPGGRTCKGRRDVLP